MTSDEHRSPPGGFPLSEQRTQPKRGVVLGGRYELIEPLGRGGMGSVWKARHVTLGSQVAVKLINGELLEDDKIRMRFLREAQAAAHLKTRHVLQVLDYGVEGNLPFIAMELAHGETLQERLFRKRTLEPEAMMPILMGVARALREAHASGIVHRDIKPDNIFIAQQDGTEVTKVLDFGIARLSPDLGVRASQFTHAGTLLGTPGYMSPEQVERQEDVDHRSDIWAFAIIAYECLLGRLPFETENLGATLVAICTKTPTLPSSVGEVPPGFDEWFSRATAKDANERFSDIWQAAEGLRRLSCETCESEPPPPSYSLPPTRTRLGWSQADWEGSEEPTGLSPPTRPSNRAPLADVPQGEAEQPGAESDVDAASVMTLAESPQGKRRLSGPKPTPGTVDTSSKPRWVSPRGLFLVVALLSVLVGVWVYTRPRSSNAATDPPPNPGRTESSRGTSADVRVAPPKTPQAGVDLAPGEAPRPNVETEEPEGLSGSDKTEAPQPSPSAREQVSTPPKSTPRSATPQPSPAAAMKPAPVTTAKPSPAPQAGERAPSPQKPALGDEFDLGI